jgi:hypothetical protein
MKDKKVRQLIWKKALNLGFSNITTVHKETYRNYVDSGGNTTDETYSSWNFVTEEVTPTQTHLSGWLREQKFISLIPEPTSLWKYKIKYRYMNKEGKHFVGYIRTKRIIDLFDTYEQAMEHAIMRALEFLESN